VHFHLLLVSTVSMPKRDMADRSIELPSSYSHGLLACAVFADAAGSVLLAASSSGFDFDPRRWGSAGDFTAHATDAVLMCVLRVALVLLASIPIRSFIRREQRGLSQLIEEERRMGEAGDGGGRDIQQQCSRDGSPKSTFGGYIALPSSPLQDGDDEFSAERSRSMLRAKHSRIIVCTVLTAFLVLNVCNVLLSIKSLYFVFSWSPWQEILMSLSVLWVNVEVFTLRSFLNMIVKQSDAFLPLLHPHPIKFNHEVFSTKCDVCNARVLREGFECGSCDFDVCLECFRKKSAAHGENMVRRGDRGLRIGDSDGSPTANGGGGAGGASFSPASYVMRAARFMLPFWPIVVLALACLVASQVVRVTLPDFQGKVLDSVINKDGATFWRYIRLYIVLSCVTLVLGSVRSFCTMLVMRNVIIQVRKRLFHSLIFRDIAFFDGSTVGSLTARMTNDANAMVNPLSTLINSVLSNFITLGGGLLMCVTVSWRLSMVSFTVIGPIVYITGAYAKWSAKLNKRVWDSLADANSIATEAFSNIRTVRAFSTESHEERRFGRSMEEALSKTLRDAVAFAGAFFATNVLDLSASAIILGFGGSISMSRPNELSMGQLVTFQLYANMMNGAYQGLNGVLNQFTRSAGAAERVLAMLDADPDIDHTSGRTLESLGGAMSFENVVFWYQMRPERMVLNNISITFPSNSVTAIVGKSGGGKSTLINLLLRFYDTKAGRVTVDGVDIKELSLPWLHHQMAVVAQDTQLFNSSIEDNIAYGRDPYTMEEVKQAARDACAHDFIESFPDGYRTVVGERGVRLSGGQRQRIAIARAFLRKPRILLLDEATSALDAQSEALVQEALDRLMRDLQGRSCTVVVVAHRLSTVVRADNIVVLKDGAVCEQGTHEQLLASQGAYAQLVSRQLQEGSGGSNVLNFDDVVVSGESSGVASPAAAAERHAWPQSGDQKALRRGVQKQ
jgi:ABC-type multidrug transport system fused ATPase/permease subunit